MEISLGKKHFTLGKTPLKGPHHKLLTGPFSLDPALRLIYHAWAWNRLSSLYREEKFLCSGAENLQTDIPSPGAKPTVLPICAPEQKIGSDGSTALGQSPPCQKSPIPVHLQPWYTSSVACALHRIMRGLTNSPN